MSFDQAEIDLERKCDEFVQKEVHYCVTALISHLMETESNNRQLSVLNTKYDFKSAAEEEGWEAVEACHCYFLINKERESIYNFQSEEVEIYDNNNFEDDTILKKWLESLSDCYYLGSEPKTEWQDLCQVEEINPHTEEVFECWLVSEQLARKLKNKGELIAENLYGLTVWGRTSMGQPMRLDDAIREIVAEMSY